MESSAATSLPMLPGPGGYSYQKSTPTRAASIESDVLVPLAQSAIFGALAGLVSIALPLWVKGWPWWSPAGIALGVTALAWWVIAQDHRRALWTIEEMTTYDIDRDGQAGPPAPPAPPIRLEITHKSQGGKRFLNFNLPQGISEADFLEFARGITLENRGLAESIWTGKGKLFSRGRYGELLDILTQAEIVRLKNPQAPAQGRELTRAGYQALLAYVSARTHAHAPTGANNYEYIERIG